MKKLIMIMGFQRSGTNALFYSMADDPAVTSFNENRLEVFYESDNMKGFLLKDEPEIREILLRDEGPALLKPISETNVREIVDVFHEYAAYDLHIPYIYRDPINVFYSWMKKGWASLDNTKDFIAHWNKRNESILEAKPAYPERTPVVRYEDLIDDPFVFFKLCRRLGIKGTYRFKADSSGGYKNVPADAIARIQDGTQERFAQLEALRDLKGSRSLFGKIVHRFLAMLYSRNYR